MANLLIRNAGGEWEAYIANTNQALRFAGATEEEQLVAVKQLANAMRAGAGNVDAIVLGHVTAFGGP